MTLGGKPLYNFTPDITGNNKKQATGDELKTFGSIWHIVKASGSVTHGSSSTTTSTGMSTGTTTMSSTTTQCLYPPCY